MDRQGEGLKECPFCGCYKEEKNKPIFIKSIEGWFKVECPICQANKNYNSTKQGAINEWNTRPPSSQKEPVWPKRNNLAELRSLWGEDSQVVELAERENEIINACIKSWKDSL